jgi:phospholipid/cholesterol/gamma-HCH transport system permease protein
MATPSQVAPPLLRVAEGVGRSVVRGLEFFGFGASIVSQAVSWLLFGRRRRQPIRSAPVFAQMMEVGVQALPIVSVLSLTIGVMLAIQGVDALASFGAEHQVAVGVALSVTREFSPLITGILVAGRSGSALAARLGTMTISNEIDALRVMGINPVRFLVVPNLVALVVMLPALVVWADFVSLLGAGLYVTADLGISAGAYVDQTIRYLDAGDVMHGLGKSVIFGVLITVVGVVNGASVRGGAEGVGRVTTRSVVHAITAIVVTDMIFVFVATR